MGFSLRMAAGAMLAFASTAQGQARVGVHQVTVAPRGGFIAFDKASGIDNAAALGVDATYYVVPMMGLGVSATFSRPVTRADEFLVAVYLGDTTFPYRAQQPITVADVNVNATLRMPLANRFSPYLRGGVGGYTIYMDPQVSGPNNRLQRMSVNAGGGFDFRVGKNIGITLDARDMIFMNFDRARLNPVRPQAQLTRFIEDFPTPPASKKTVHNLAFQLGFSFVPAIGRPEDDR